MQTRIPVRKLCRMAVLAAIFAVLDYFAIGIGQTIKITFAGLPVLVAAVLLGPVAGALTGLVGAFISQLLRYGLTWMTLLWILPAAIRALSMGYLYRRFGRGQRFGDLLLPAIVSALLVTLANTGILYLDSIINHYYSQGLILGDLIWRVVSSVCTAAVYALILVPLLKVLPREAEPLPRL